jgi:hypothetical protein
MRDLRTQSGASPRCPTIRTTTWPTRCPAVREAQSPSILAAGVCVHDATMPKGICSKQSHRRCRETEDVLQWTEQQEQSGRKEAHHVEDASRPAQINTFIGPNHSRGTSAVIGLRDDTGTGGIERCQRFLDRLHLAIDTSAFTRGQTRRYKIEK